MAILTNSLAIKPIEFGPLFANCTSARSSSPGAKGLGNNDIIYLRLLLVVSLFAGTIVI